MSSQYSAVAERKQDLSDKWRKCLKCKWGSDLASGYSITMIVTRIFVPCSGARASRDTEILSRGFKWVRNVPGIGREVYIPFIIQLIWEEAEKSHGCCLEIGEKRRWRWDAKKTDQCLDMASMFLSKFSFYIIFIWLVQIDYQIWIGIHFLPLFSDYWTLWGFLSFSAAWVYSICWDHVYFVGSSLGLSFIYYAHFSKFRTEIFCITEDGGLDKI